jgi:carbamoyl-phosphate synthase small subunit
LVGKAALLVLADGTVYRGEAFGASGVAIGEVVFNTSMMGYQEILTDPSYAGQLVTLTYPLIGNYGVNEADVESLRVRVAGFIVREWCPQPSNWRASGTVEEYLERYGVAGIAGIDTRALTLHLRGHGVMMGAITSELSAGEALERLRTAPDYGQIDLVAQVSTPEAYRWDGGTLTPTHSQRERGPGPHIVVVDLGLKFNISCGS